MRHINFCFLFFILTGYTNALVGITNKHMYLPDTCGAACFSYFEVFRLDCSTLDEDDMVVTSNDCMSSNSNLLSSIAWCWELQCTNITDRTTRDFIDTWKSTFPNATLSYFEALGLGEPSQTLEASSNILLTEPVLVNFSLFYPYYRTNQDFYESECYHARMALSLVMITWSLVFFGMLYNIVDKFHLDEIYLPKVLRIWLRKYLLFPALFKEKCSVPVRLAECFPVDYIPPRIVSLTVFCYYIINIIFCAVPYKAFWDFQWYPHDTAGLMYTYVGNRTGVLSFANIPILILFASRNNIFQWLTGWSYATFQHYHRHVSIICVLEAFVHSVCYTIKFVKKPYSAHLYAVESAKAYWWWGVIATISCCLIPPSAILKIRVTSYEVFVIVHYVLAILFIIACTYHILDRFDTKWGYIFWLYCSYAVWGFDFFVRIFRCLYLKFRGCKSIAFVELADLESKTMKITYEVGNLTQKSIGNYYYLYFFTVFPFFTSHPFTVVEWSHNVDPDSLLLNNISTGSESEDKGYENEKADQHIMSSSSEKSKFVFYVQCMKGITRHIYNKLEENNFEPIQIKSVLEGPYGSYERAVFHAYDFIIFLTGGIGNTVVINYVRSFVDYKEKSALKESHDVKLFILHLDRYQGRLEFLKNKLNDLIPTNASNDVDIQFHNTASGGRIDLNQYLKEKINAIETKYPHGIRRIGVVTCGPAKFNDTCRRTCVELQDNIEQDTIVSYIADPFDW